MARRPEAWRSYAAGSEVDHFADFCKTQLIQSEDKWEGQPFALEPWQRRMLGEALAYEPDGWPIWRSVVMIAPRKNGKTQLLAALALYRLLTSTGRPEVLLAASSDRQADRLFDAASRFVRRNEELSNLLRVRDHAGEIVREDGLGIIVRLTSDPARLYGYSPTDVICDELAWWTTPNLKRAYAALTSGGGAFGPAGLHDHDRRRGGPAARLDPRPYPRRRSRVRGRRAESGPDGLPDAGGADAGLGLRGTNPGCARHEGAEAGQSGVLDLARPTCAGRRKTRS